MIKNKAKRRKIKRLMRGVRSTAASLWLSKPMDVARTAVCISMYPPFLWDAQKESRVCTDTKREVVAMNKKKKNLLKRLDLAHAAKKFILVSTIIYDGVIRELTCQSGFKQPLETLPAPTPVCKNERGFQPFKQSHLNIKIKTRHY